MRLTTFAGTDKSTGTGTTPPPNTPKINAKTSPTLSIPTLNLPFPSLKTEPAEDTFKKREAPPEDTNLPAIMISDDDNAHTPSLNNDEYLAVGRSWNDLESEATRQEEDRVAQHAGTGRLMSPKDDKGDEENLSKMNLPGK